MTRSPSVWPSGIRRTPAETRLAAKACMKACAVGASGSAVRGGCRHRRRRDRRSRSPCAASRSMAGCGHTACTAAQEGRALRQRLQPALGGRREGCGQLGALRPAGVPSPAATARQASARKIASVRPAPCTRISSIQSPERGGILDLAVLDHPFQPVRVARTRPPETPATATSSGGRACGTLAICSAPPCGEGLGVGRLRHALSSFPRRRESRQLSTSLAARCHGSPPSRG